MDTVIQIGEKAPGFELPGLDGKMHSLNELNGQVVVLNFWSAECVWSQRVDEELVIAVEEWGERVVTLWVASNANEPRELIEGVVAERKLPGVLLDAQHQVADRYGAQVTPQFFIVDVAGKLAYQGAWDDITFRKRTATQKYVRDAVDALLVGRSLQVEQTEPYGCTLVRYE